jgi:glycosyltransferase involved in cell wall biosynthesis
LIEAVHAARAARAIAALGPFDVVHDHSVAGPLTASAAPPAIVTAHGPVSGPAGDLYEALADRIAVVAISAAQRATRPDLPWLDIVHNGIRVEDFPFSADKEEFLLFLGRIHPDKAPHVAIDTARALGLRLVIAAKCTEPCERAYFEQAIEPRLGPGVEWIGEADRDLKTTLLRRAMGLLFPIAWDEPFGLVMVEAMACGTPVIATRRGAAPEIVVDGVTGFLSDDPANLTGAVRAIGRLDPGDCRRHVERRFSAARMVEAYERLFTRVASEGSALTAR